MSSSHRDFEPPGGAGAFNIAAAPIDGRILAKVLEPAACPGAPSFRPGALRVAWPGTTPDLGGRKGRCRSSRPRHLDGGGLSGTRGPGAPAVLAWSGSARRPRPIRTSQPWSESHTAGCGPVARRRGCPGYEYELAVVTLPRRRACCRAE